MERCDVIVIGAGPAGLTAATYLARFRRKVIVLDGGPPRAAWIPESHNTPGFPGGVGGPELIRRLVEQAQRFGARIEPGLASAVAIAEDVFVVQGPRGLLRAAAVLLAAGVVDRLPAIPGLTEAIRSGVARMCPICDGYEAIDKRIAVLGCGELAQREAAFLRTYSSEVAVLRLDDSAARAREGDTVELTDLAFTHNAVEVRVPGRSPRTFDHLYLAMGCAPQSELAAQCGAQVDAGGSLLVDTHQMTSVEGLYAAGDLVRGLNQIAVATGEAAIAATAIHNRLRDAAAR